MKSVCSDCTPVGVCNCTIDEESKLDPKTVITKPPLPAATIEGVRLEID
jgi:hypothetical protein